VVSVGLWPGLSSYSSDFDDVYEQIRSRLVKVLVARYGPDLAADLTSDVTAYAWEHRERLATMDNPLGYLYRVAQSKARRYSRWDARSSAPVPEPRIAHLPDVDLRRHLESLPVKQRMCIVLVHGYQWTYDETAIALDLSVAAVRNHLYRGLRTLRRIMMATEGR
jgi:RNA polymerase sigma factor (sigma-70 family)